MKLPSIANAAAVSDAAVPPAIPVAAGGAPKAAATPNAAIDPQALQQLADRLAESVGMTGQQVQFSVDDDTGTTVLRVTDAESGALLRQIPGDEALAMARILDNMKGVLIRQKA